MKSHKKNVSRNAFLDRRKRVSFWHTQWQTVEIHQRHRYLSVSENQK